MILDYIYVIYLYTNTIPKNVPCVERSFLRHINTESKSEKALNNSALAKARRIYRKKTCDWSVVTNPRDPHWLKFIKPLSTIEWPLQFAASILIVSPSTHN